MRQLYSSVSTNSSSVDHWSSTTNILINHIRQSRMNNFGFYVRADDKYPVHIFSTDIRNWYDGTTSIIRSIGGMSFKVIHYTPSGYNAGHHGQVVVQSPSGISQSYYIK